MSSKITNATVGLFAGVFLLSTAACGGLSEKEIDAKNAKMAFEVCRDGEALIVLEPQTEKRGNGPTTSFPPNGKSDFGDFWLTDQYDFARDFTPSPTEKDPNPKTRPGYAYQKFVTFRYVLEPEKTVARLYIKPSHGQGQEISPAIQSGSEGSSVFMTTDFAESEAPFLIYQPALIESVSLCVK